MTTSNTKALFLRDNKVRLTVGKILFALLSLSTFLAAPYARAETAVLQTFDLAPASSSTQISFAVGQDTLDPFARQNLDQMVRDANARGKVDRVQVISWGDSNNTTNTNPSVAEQELAASRARAVENYLLNRGNGLSVKTYNMVQQPSALQELLNGGNSSMVSSLRQAGITNNQTSKPSTVVVMMVTRDN